MIGALWRQANWIAILHRRRTYLLKCLSIWVLIWVLFKTLTSVMMIGVTPSGAVSCLVDPATIYLINKLARAPVNGELYALDVSGVPLMQKQHTATVIKYVVAQHGDRVSVSSQGVAINGLAFGAGGLSLAALRGVDSAYFEREFIVPVGKIFVMGDAATSFDSRYWGVLDTDRIIGRATGL